MTEDPVHGADESYVSSRTPDDGVTPKAEDVEPATPEEFGSVQLRWGDGKGETTAASRVGVDAVGHGYRVHVPQFMKRGVTSVEEIRGEYDTIGTTPRISDGNSGHYGWHGLRDGTDADAHASRVHRGLERARELLASRGDSDLESAPPIDRSSEDGVSMLILDEIRYAVTRDLIGPDAVVNLIEAKPERFGPVRTGGPERPTHVRDHAPLVTTVSKEHPFETGHRARKGTEYR